jgi:hypothetical protein
MHSLKKINISNYRVQKVSHIKNATKYYNNEVGNYNLSNKVYLHYMYKYKISPFSPIIPHSKNSIKIAN